MEHFWIQTFTFVFQERLAEGESVDPEEEDAWYMRRLDAGLFTLQNVDYILAWVSMEDDGVSTILRCC